MQTPAELRLIDTLADLLRPHDETLPALLSVGAGKSALIEDTLVARGARFISDRLDLIDAHIDRPYVRNVFCCAAQAMAPVPARAYEAAFSNYLLEHVEDVRGAAAEIFRVLRPGGVYVASVPNPTALEFRLARWTPLWFHKLVRGHVVGEKYYSYRSIAGLVELFEKAGFRAKDVWHFSSTEDYLQRFPIVRALARGYDRALMAADWRKLMGNVCLVLQKPREA
jgi:SAM-dependent methyltransferase